MLERTPLERGYRRTVEGLLLRRIAGRRVTPNQLTVAGLVVAAVAGCLAPPAPLAAGIVLLAAGLLDTLDGALARASGRASPRGAFLDSTLDRYAEFFVIVGCWARTACLGEGMWGALWALFAVQGSLMVSYARARAEGLGQPIKGGLFQHPERLLLLALGLLVSPWEEGLGLGPAGALLWTLALLAGGANGTALARMTRGWRALGD